MNEAVFSIARNFSLNPGPRKIRQGANSGEALRKRLAGFLAGASGKVMIELDGTKGMGSSFLDEAFGGLVTYEGMDAKQLLRRLIFRSLVDPSYVEEIRESITRAEPGHA